MTLYLYRTGETVPLLAIGDAAAYTADGVTAADGAVHGPFAEDCELSSLPDCSETLRADWRAANPPAERRLEEIEALLAALLFGGEAV